MSDQPVNVNVNIGTPGPVQVQHKTGCLLQLIYFIFIGWWLGGLAITVAYLLFIPVITIPIGVKIINRISYIMALRESPQQMTMWGQQVQVKQHNIILRTMWFIFIGLWVASLWMSVAYLLCLTIIGMPAGFWMFDRTSALLTLRKAA